MGKCPLSEDILQANWRLSDDAIANSVGWETVILHLGSGTYFGLDPIGSLLWEGIKAGQLPSEVCIKILEEYDTDRETIESDLRTFIQELSCHGLVVRD